MRVERYGGSAAEWDDFAARQQGYTHYHRHGWRGVMERSLGHECLYLAARNDAGTLEAVLPLVRVKSFIFGHYLVSMPFLNYGGPLGTAEGIAAVAAEAVEQARRDRVKLLELRSRVQLPIDLPVSHRKITVVLDLDANPDAVFKRFDAKLRSQIRKPQKEGIVMRFGPEQVEPFFHVFSHHMRDLGTPTLSRRFFRDIAATLPDTTFACAYLGDVPVAAGCGFTFGDEFELSWASSLREYNRQAPNMLLYWGLMEHLIAAGCRRFNFGRCTPGSGTHRFKSQWGGRDEQLWWYDVAKGERATTTPSPNEGAFSWGPRIWRRIPTRIATAVGPAIIRFIP